MLVQFVCGFIFAVWNAFAAVKDKLVQLATLDGHLNGPDGVGIRWEDYDDDGTIDEIVAGRPILNSAALETWPTLTREFEVYRWDMAQQTLIKAP